MSEIALKLDSQAAWGPLPALVRPATTATLADYLPALSQCAAQELRGPGALLFRDFPVQSLTDFERLTSALTPDLVDYTFASTPRSRVQGRVYTSTEYPAHQRIPQHNEQSYTAQWPLKVWFHCVQAAVQGGSTPLTDSREVYREIPPAIRERFAAKGVMYVRNYCNDGNGLDVAWQQVFGTHDRAQVEAFCRQSGISWEWKDDGELRTRQVCQAVATHPTTREMVWFNQAHLFHLSNLEPAAQQALLACLDECDLPRNAYYGDGQPLEDEVLATIRAIYGRLTREFAWQQGDVLLVDNMLVAHGRAPYQGPRKVVVAMAQAYPLTL